MPAMAATTRSWADIARGPPASAVQSMSSSEPKQDALEVHGWAHLGLRVASVFSAADDDEPETRDGLEETGEDLVEPAEDGPQSTAQAMPLWPAAGHGSWAQSWGVAHHPARVLANAGDACGGEPQDLLAPLRPVPYGEKRCW